MAVGVVIVIVIVTVLLSGGEGENSLEFICAGGGDKNSVERISCRCFLCGYS